MRLHARGPPATSIFIYGAHKARTGRISLYGIAAARRDKPREPAALNRADGKHQPPGGKLGPVGRLFAEIDCYTCVYSWARGLSESGPERSASSSLGSRLLWCAGSAEVPYNARARSLGRLTLLQRRAGRPARRAVQYSAATNDSLSLCRPYTAARISPLEIFPRIYSSPPNALWSCRARRCAAGDKFMRPPHPRPSVSGIIFEGPAGHFWSARVSGDTARQEWAKVFMRDTERGRRAYFLGLTREV